MEQKYLPIGSVVLTKKFTNKAMILGHKIQTMDENKETFDYVGCVYPEGIVDTKKYLAFNHSDIDTVLNKGFSNEESQQYISFIEKREKESN